MMMGERMSEKQPLGNNERSETSVAGHGNFWSPSVVRHSQLERLIWKSNSVEDNTVSII